MNDRRLIEDYLPIVDISDSCKEEENYKKSRFGRPFGHLHQMHKWFATRPLVACRAALYASLVTAPSSPNGRGPKSEFMKRLCKYPGDPRVIETARQHIREAHQERTGSDEPPKVLDCFAGSGSIPLEILNLGCDAYAIELNPVAYLIELCTLVYSQKFGKPNPNVVGCKDGRWAGLAKEAENWGKWVVKHVHDEIGELYSPILNTIVDNAGNNYIQTDYLHLETHDSITENTMVPIAYLWTRTVRCKKPGCEGIVPLIRQTWLCKKSGKKSGLYVALKLTADKSTGMLFFNAVQSDQKSEIDAIYEFGFDPGQFSKGGSSACVICGTVADGDYVKLEGKAGRIGQHLMAIVFTYLDKNGKLFIGIDDIVTNKRERLRNLVLPNDTKVWELINKLCFSKEELTIPEEELIDKAADQLPLYGITQYRQLFTARQLLMLLTFTKWLKMAYKQMITYNYNDEMSKAITTVLGLWVSTIASYNSCLCSWKSSTSQLAYTFPRHDLAMVWDFAEANPFGGASGDAN